MEEALQQQRLAQAAHLHEFVGAAFGFDLETCIHSLKVNEDDIERAQAWLMGPQVTAWKRSQIGKMMKPLAAWIHLDGSLQEASHSNLVCLQCYVGMLCS